MQSDSEYSEPEEDVDNRLEQVCLRDDHRQYRLTAEESQFIKACQNNNMECAKKLLEKDATLAAMNERQDMNPWAIAITNRNRELIGILQRYGAKADVISVLSPDICGIFTHLEYAALQGSQGHWDLIPALLSNETKDACEATVALLKQWDSQFCTKPGTPRVRTALEYARLQKADIVVRVLQEKAKIDNPEPHSPAVLWSAAAASSTQPEVKAVQEMTAEDAQAPQQDTQTTAPMTTTKPAKPATSSSSSSSSSSSGPPL